jgi:hypothetical protein
VLNDRFSAREMDDGPSKPFSNQTRINLDPFCLVVLQFPVHTCCFALRYQNVCLYGMRTAHPHGVPIGASRHRPVAYRTQKKGHDLEASTLTSAAVVNNAALFLSLSFGFESQPFLLACTHFERGADSLKLGRVSIHPQSGFLSPLCRTVSYPSV